MSNNDGKSMLVSLREIAGDLNSEQCNLQAEVVLRIGHIETPWILSIDTEYPSFDTDGNPRFSTFLCRADIMPGEHQFELDVTDTWGGLDAEMIAQQFGLDGDMRVWRVQWHDVTHDA